MVRRSVLSFDFVFVNFLDETETFQGARDIVEASFLEIQPKRCTGKLDVV